MSEHLAARPARRRSGLLLLIAAFVIANVLVVGRLARFWYLSEPNRQITIGPETTYLEGPLTADGYVDYIAALNLRQSEGVTPENNAVTLLVQAYGPEIIGDGIRDRYFELLGVPPPPVGGGRLLSEDAFVRQTKAAPDHAAATQELRDQRETASQRPWTRAEFPNVAALLDANAAPLQLITAAGQRERYYSPLLATGPAPSMFAILLPLEQQQREAARQLTARAMLKLGEGDPAGAWEDLLACHRLARLTGQTPFFIAALVCVAIDAVAMEADRALIASPALSGEQARTCLADLQNLPPLPSMADVLDHSERLSLIDAATQVARGQSETFLDQTSSRNVQPTMTGAIEWDQAFEVINDHCDALVAAMREPDAATRVRKLDELVHVVKARDPFVSGLGVRSFLGNRESASRDMGWALLHHLLPACNQANVAETRAVARERVLRVGFALAAFRAEHQAYPESLAELVPSVLSELPIDPWSGKDLVYRRAADGFVVYSLGDDMQDDGGLLPNPNTAPVPSGIRHFDIVVRVGSE